MHVHFLAQSTFHLKGCLQEITMLILRIPSQRAKVDTGLQAVKADLEKKLIPQGSAVVRHTALPHKGQSEEWIFAEMTHMDEEIKGDGEWKHGKVSGAVYRACYKLILSREVTDVCF